MKRASYLFIALWVAGCDPDHTAGYVDPDPSDGVRIASPRVAGPSALRGASAEASITHGSPGLDVDAPGDSTQSPQATPPTPGLTGQLSYALSEVALASGQTRSTFAASELSSLWVRVHVSTMPEVAQLTLGLLDDSDAPFYSLSAWFSPRGGLPGVGQAIRTGDSSVDGYDLDLQADVPSGAHAGQWHVEARLGGYATVIEGVLTIQ